MTTLALAVARSKGVTAQVVALGDLGPIALLEDDLLLGQEVVRVGPVELPDLVQDRQLGLGVEAEVADQFSDVGPVLLLNVGPIVLVARAGPGEGDLVVVAVGQQVISISVHLPQDTSKALLF